MSTKLKALGAGLLAMLAVGAFGVMNASADPEDPHSGGHFVSEVEETTIVGTEEGANHNLEFSVEGGTPIDCTDAEYHGTADDFTETELTITPKWDKCYTTSGSPSHTIAIHENGCDLNFTVNTKPETSHNAVHVECPTSKDIEITHPNCNITIGPQTVTGVTYTTDVVDGAHAITLDSTVENIKAEFHGGICVFLGTNHTGEMLGSVTVQGLDHDTEEPVDITATG